MLKINENKTLRELREKGFGFSHIELLYYIKEGVYLAFDLDVDSKDFLKYIGEECYLLRNTSEYEKERLESLNELKESGFVVDEKD